MPRQLVDIINWGNEVAPPIFWLLLGVAVLSLILIVYLTALPGTGHRRKIIALLFALFLTGGGAAAMFMRYGDADVPFPRLSANLTPVHIVSA